MIPENAQNLGILLALEAVTSSGCIRESHGDIGVRGGQDARGEEENRKETSKKLLGPKSRVSTGIGGLDYLLRGGLPSHRIHLIEGHPGAGKTTLGLQFLLEGVKRGESCMYITLSETAEELRANAASHGWDLSGIHMQEFQPTENLRPEEQYTLFHPSEIELGDLSRNVFEAVENIQAGTCGARLGVGHAAARERLAAIPASDSRR